METPTTLKGMKELHVELICASTELWEICKSTQNSFCASVSVVIGESGMGPRIRTPNLEVKIQRSLTASNYAHFG